MPSTHKTVLVSTTHERTLAYIGARRGIRPHPYLKGTMPKCILIVDDCGAIRRFLRSFLEAQSDFEVCGEAVDGKEGIKKAAELKPDLIILDYSMPKLNGLEVAAALNKTMPEVPIILFTLHKDAILSDGAHHPGITSVVAKSGEPETLFEEVKRLMFAV